MRSAIPFFLLSSHFPDASFTRGNVPEVALELESAIASDRQITSIIGAIFTHMKGGFYHDGRFATLDAVVDHYNTCMNLGLTPSEKSDVVQYLLSLTF